MMACKQFTTMGSVITNAMQSTLESDPTTGCLQLTEGGCDRLARELRRHGIRVFRHGSSVGTWMPSVPWVTSEEAWWGWGWPWQWQRFVGAWSARDPWAWCGDHIRPPSWPDPWPMPDPWRGWVMFGGAMPDFGLAQIARCAGGCPQRSIPGFSGGCSMRGCPWLCRGCQAGWPYDGNLRHIGPAKYPAANRWDCNRVKWLGVQGAPPDYAQVANY
jgi:hypothetical protein